MIEKKLEECQHHWFYLRRTSGKGRDPIKITLGWSESRLTWATSRTRSGLGKVWKRRRAAYIRCHTRLWWCIKTKGLVWQSSPPPWYTAGAQPKHGIIPKRGEGAMTAIERIPRWNAFIYIKLVFTLRILSKMAPALVARQRAQEKRWRQATGKVGGEGLISCTCWGGRVWQGLMIIEYYQAMVKSPNVKLTRCIQGRSWFKIAV